MTRHHLTRLGLALTITILTAAAARAAPAPIPAAGVQADLRLAVDTIERAHPDLAHSVDRRRLDRTAGRIARDLTGPMTQAQAWAALAQLNPVLADGHLFIGLPDWREDSVQALSQGSAFFPFEVSADPNGEVRIVSALGGGPTPFAGRRIRRINGQDARQVTRMLLARVHGDTPRFRAALLSQRWWLFYAKIYGAPAVFDLDLAGAGRQFTPASRATPALLARDASFERLYRCAINERGAVLTVGAFAWPDKQRVYDFTHDCFARIAAARATRLIIDVRQNGGGDDDMWRDGLLRYIADRPYRHGSRYVKRVLQPRARRGRWPARLGRDRRRRRAPGVGAAALPGQGLRPGRRADLFICRAVQQRRPGLRLRQGRGRRRRGAHAPVRGGSDPAPAQQRTYAVLSSLRARPPLRRRPARPPAARHPRRRRPLAPAGGGGRPAGPA